MDRFNGDPAPNTTTGSANEANPTLIEQIKLRAAETAKSFMIDMWLARHSQEGVMKILMSVLGGMKEEFADAEANGGVYCAGYCFGGKV